MTAADIAPYDPDKAIAAIEDPLVRTIAGELRDLGYRAMVDRAEQIAATLRHQGLTS